jgi:hypothetical protein
MEAVATQNPSNVLPHDANVEEVTNMMNNICRSFMRRKCTKNECKYVHDTQLCYQFWKDGRCKYAEKCRKKHSVTTVKTTIDQESFKEVSNHTSTSTNEPEPEVNEDVPTSINSSNEKKQKKNSKQQQVVQKKKPLTRSIKPKKNTETWEPMTKPVDLRIVYDLGNGNEVFSTSLTTRDVLLAPNVFSDFKKGEIYTRLVEEIQSCGIASERLLKMWHGNDHIDGTHLIADDKTRWKKECPTFSLVIDRLKAFFNMNIQATRFNWYVDTSQWKPFHFDAAAVKPEVAKIQNFTVAVSFGATRDAAFEHAETRAVVSVPQADGCIYAVAKDTNCLWRHGILQDIPVRQEGRISIIAWGWIDEMQPILTE